MTSDFEKFTLAVNDNDLPVFRKVGPLLCRNYKIIRTTDEDRRIKILLRAISEHQSTKPILQSRLAGWKRKALTLGRGSYKRKKLTTFCCRGSKNKLSTGRERPNGAITRKRPSLDEPPCPSKRPCLTDRDSDASKPVSGSNSAWFTELGLSATDIEMLGGGEWLTDDHIHAAQTLLRRQFPALAGLQNPILGEILQFQSMTTDGVQVVLNGGQHWVTVCKTDGVVKLLDSKNAGLSPKLSSQIVNLCGGRDQGCTARLEVHLPKMHPQRGSSDCGVFALAYATEIAFGGSPEYVVFDQRTLRQHLKSCLASLKMTPFPKMNCSPRTVKLVGTKSEILNF